ncbi:MAG: Ppx/GppA phosphatase family protein, partial [Vicinamibacterales bacterium]|nr:Ppx/GppA phosphatase family protein [Vicinamibacterales bacterium]
MQLAAIDIGTNSLHMIIVKTAPDSSFEVVGREKDMVRLGAGGLEGRPLSDGAMASALQTLARFKRLAESRAVDDIVAVATSAVREAPNGGDFLAAIERQTGIRARVITGTEEARLIHRAAVHGVDVGAGSAVVIDIGGGSTEITIGSAAGAQQARSFRLGVIRLGDRYAKSDPLSERDERRLARHVARELGDDVRNLGRAGYDRVIGTSGTILGLGGLLLDAGAGASLHHRRVSAKAIRRLRRDLVALTLAERMRLPGLDPRRADLIVPGVVLLDIILRQLGTEEITLCELSLREGVVLDYLRRNRQEIERIARYPDIRRRSVVELAQRCSYAADHAQQVARLALAIFDQTRSVHGLDAQARELLDHAALLHDIGEHISYERHHRHSYYLIKNGDLRGFDPLDIEMMALVTRYHRRGTPKRSHPGFAALSRTSRRTVRWMAAMVTLAEGLDRSRAQLVHDIRLEQHDGGWTMQLVVRGDVELECWAAQRHLAPLEKALKSPVRLL